MVSSILVFLVVLVLIWLGILTFFFRRYYQNYSLFTAGGKKKTFDEVLNSIIGQIHIAKKDIDVLSHKYAKMEKSEQFHIQKIGLLRFNPFKDTGGEQSFILALTDSYDTGILITALYSRTGTRWYAKRVVQGKGAELELSEEEKKALTMSRPSN